MSKREKFQNRGSALLVVLGFLSFMIISAVSFCIYMRVERQASSTYRHSVTARHLLEAGLYRAMDEVDANLRAANTKFPTFPENPLWEDRVFISKSNTPEQESARVLSLEALSFLPAALVNDARVSSVSGVEWRRMSMPLEGKVDIKNNQARSSGNKSYVGRYAYICVNLSDMLNINGCTVAPWRGPSNLVSVASLFGTPMDSTLANQLSLQCSNDVHYATMQDFYACMAVASKNYFGGPSDSPYVQFLKDGKNISFNDSYNHILVADGFAKAPPARKAACNVTLNPPYTKNSTTINSVFYDKIKEMFPEEQNNVNRQQKVFEATLVDYLSSDDVGLSRRDVPSSKLAPMICQIRLSDFITPIITTETQGAPPNEKTIYNLNLVSDANALPLGLQVRVCFPFKNVEDRIKPYTVTVEGFIRIDKEGSEPNLTSRISQTPDVTKDIPFTGTATIDPPSINGAGDAQTDQGKCYKWIREFSLNIPTAPIKMADSDNAVYNGFNINKKINLALVLTSVRVHRGAVVYDSTPESPIPEDVIPKAKLYFQTKEVDIRVPGKIDYLWSSLEVPDPRFNHFAVNWLNNSGEADRDEENTIHKITKDLLGSDGRDADIFLSSSGAEKFQSIGELGFLVRPYNYEPSRATASVNFRDKKAIDPANDDSDAYFRTIRLYDHGAGHPQDKVYQNFYMAQDADGNLPLGANVRINPLSTVGAIIECALDRIPYNFNVANGGSTQPKQNFTEGVLKDDWVPFVQRWATVFTNTIREVGLNTTFNKTVADFYGDHARMGWYAPKAAVDPDPRTTIFTGGFVAQTPVYEIDRKMLYAFSLDSMSDRQQLFLYVFQAEAVAPISFTEMRSLAGGRAVAVVWRDPYPLGSTPDTPAGLTDTWYEHSGSGGSKGYYEHKILFFKQLDN